MSPVNEFGQPVGDGLGDWVAPPFPEPATLIGRYCTLEPLQPDHASSLFPTFSAAPDSLWTYMSIGPFDSEDSMRAAFAALIALPDWVPFAILVDGKAVGFLSYLRVDPPGGVVEIGSIVFAPELRRTTAATEAIFLLLKYAFGLGYRRCEWKCDDLNAPSQRAADRLGFGYEGTFKKATHYKGRNRDTAWYAITDDEWADIELGFEDWLAPANFDNEGRQRKPLRAFRS
jgi:RimJ/RimL family protein N-acetyltransferase